jgi:excisionase family DNA binding protein
VHLSPDVQRRLDALAQTVASMEYTALSHACTIIDQAIHQAAAVAKFDDTQALHQEPPPSGHLTISTAARCSGVCERTLRRWIASGKLQAVKRRGRVFVDPARIAQLMQYARHEISGHERDQLKPS